MSQKSLEIFPELILPLDSIGSEEIIGSARSIGSEEIIASEEIIGSARSIDSAGSIDLANFSESAGFIDLANFSESEEIIWSEAFIGSEAFINSEAFITSEGFFTSEASVDSEYSRSQEDSLALQYSESTGNPIFFQETNLEDSLTSRNPISFQETTAFDPLTGIANNATSNGIFNGMFNGFKVNALRQPQLSINLSTNIPNYATVTTSVKVELTPLVNLLVYFDLVDFTLQSSIWGIDGRGWFQGGADDYLFGFSDQEITGSGTYTFSQTVPKGWLNEDTIWPNNYDDEIQGRFKLVSSDNAFPLNLEARSGIITGRYY